MSVRATFIIRKLLFVATCTATGIQPLQAQSAASDSAFLACARHSDRGQRIACLEDALQAAMTPQGAPSAAPAAAAPSTVSQAAPASTATTAADTDSEVVAADEPSLLERVKAFGREVTVSKDDDGSERLHDSITALEKRNDLWIVTLSSGQVWRQEVPRTLNLRVGDAIEIYQGGFGNGYLLATPRLSGFIRVERVR